MLRDHGAGPSVQLSHYLAEQALQPVGLPYRRPEGRRRYAGQNLPTGSLRLLAVFEVVRVLIGWNPLTDVFEGGSHVGNYVLIKLDQHGANPKIKE